MNEMIYLIIGLAIAFAGSYFDFWTSVRGLAYGTQEGNSWFRDNRGYFSGTRFWIGHLIYCALPLPFIFFGAPLWVIGGIWFFVGTLSAVRAWMNINNQKKSRTMQIEALRVLRAGGRPRIKDIVRYTDDRDQWWRYPLFQWIYTDEADQEVARQKLSDALSALAAKPESAWFEGIRLTEV